MVGRFFFVGGAYCAFEFPQFPAASSPQLQKRATGRLPSTIVDSGVRHLFEEEIKVETVVIELGEAAGYKSGKNKTKKKDKCHVTSESVITRIFLQTVLPQTVNFPTGG